MTSTDQRELTDIICEAYEKYGQELWDFHNTLAPKYSVFTQTKEYVFDGPQTVELENEINWLLIRHLKPEIVIEIGACSGWSTSYLVDAVIRNAAADGMPPGKVFSYDLLDNSAINLAHVFSAEELDSVWELVQGNTYETFDIEKIKELGKIGYVFVDSDHSGEYARWYIQEILEKLDPGCGVAIHDIVAAKTGEYPDPRINQDGTPMGLGGRFEKDTTEAHGARWVLEADDHQESFVVSDWLNENAIPFINPNPGEKNFTPAKRIGEYRLSADLPPAKHDSPVHASSAIFYVR